MTKYIKKIASKLFVRMMFHLIYIVAIAALPYIIKNMIDSDFSQGIIVAGQHIIMFICMIGVGMLAQYITQKTAWRAECDLNKLIRKDLFLAIVQKPTMEFEKRTIGKYTSLLENDVSALGEYVEYCLEAAEYVFSLITYAIFLFALDARIAIIIYCVTVATLFLPKLTAKNLARKKGNLLDVTGHYISKVNDLLSGYSVVNTSTENGVARRHNHQLEEMEEGRFAYGKYKSFVNVFNGSMMYLIDISAFIIIALLLVNGQITAGVATATITYIREFSAPLRGVIDSLSAIKSVSGVKSALLKELSYRHTRTARVENWQKIVFEHVDVIRGEFELKNFCYTFESGKKYAIIGESGSGKSTILRLLTKGIQSDGGRILVDGQDALGIDMMSVVAYMDQNTHVFAENFLDNITVFGSYPKEYMQKRMPWIKELRLTSVVDKSDCATASGGEKQLIAFLRTLMSGGKLLVLDEPFSAVDKKREMMVTRMLLEQAESTVIMVTHNTAPEFLAQFDEVLKM